MTTKERMSALMDGELPPEECAELLTALHRDPGALGDFARYQLIREVLREGDRWPMRAPAPASGTVTPEVRAGGGVLRLRRRGEAGARFGRARKSSPAFNPVWVGSLAASVAIIALLLTGYPDPEPHAGGSAAAPGAIPGAGEVFPAPRSIAGAISSPGPAAAPGPGPGRGAGGAGIRSGSRAPVQPGPGLLAAAPGPDAPGEVAPWLPDASLTGAAPPARVDWQTHRAEVATAMWGERGADNRSLHGPEAGAGLPGRGAGESGARAAFTVTASSRDRDPGAAPASYAAPPRGEAAWADPRERLRMQRYLIRHGELTGSAFGPVPGVARVLIQDAALRR